MELSGGGRSAEGLADEGSREGTHDGEAASQPARISRRVKITLASIALAIFCAGIVRWNFLPPSDRYILPASPEDWAAWGTWVGAVGSIGAVFFASLSIKHAIEAQRGTERELKRDRVHDREEREKERDLVREEREALTKEVDRIALNEAGKLSFSYSTGIPSDSEYAEVAYERYLEESLDGYQRGAEEDDFKTQVAYVTIKNASRDLVFDDITLWLRDDSFKLAGVEVADRDAPHVRKDEELLEGSPPEWTWRTDYEPVFPPETHQWALGSVKAGRQLMVKFSFATSHHINEWSTANLWRDAPGSEDPRHLILGYRDQAGRYWIRSTVTARNSPQRLLEAAAVT